ncbi:PREDICTED: cuticlin-1-like [Priapulus caudatus]|uniref:Cuticlin-1-like n=1 Tax=Priapulus caudatus TaxID=37621 RepID=A0ABM1ERK7_PRICU|nr:PREDICTED: cuticlin-1-like [Priapulus caudatus]
MRIILAITLIAAINVEAQDRFLPMVEPANPMEDLKLRCNADTNQLVVSAKFTRAFNGYLYAKGFYETRGCRALGTGSPLLELVLPLDGCGTVKSGPGTSRSFYNNTVIIMNEAEWGLLGMMDASYSVSCQFGGDSVQRFDWGFTVPMLTTRGVVTVTSEAPSCSMKIVQGQDPLAQPTTLLFLGDIATMVFETRGDGRYGIFVSECRVHDGTSTGVITLLDDDGCPAHRKLIGLTRYDDNSLIRGSRLAYSHFKVFKFPDQANVYFECKCHVCFGECTKPACSNIPGSGFAGKRRRRQAENEADVTANPANDKDMTVELYNTITVVVPPEPNAKPDSAPNSLASSFQDRLAESGAVEMKSCLSPAYLIIAVVTLGLLLLLFMTLSALFYHRSRHQRKDIDDVHESSIYSGSRINLSARSPSPGHY